MPFQRTGAFPLDRTAIFSSLADAKLYATKGEDSRKLSGTSYIGQIIVVYENDSVAAYIIANQTDAESCLMKLAQSTASGDIAGDVANLKTQVANIQASIEGLQDTVGEHTTKIADIDGRVQTIENLPEVTYEIAAGDADGQIKLICKHDGVAYGDPVNAKVNGWDTLVAIANGHTKIYVYQNKADEQYVADIANKNKFKLGDMILFKEANIPDQWVTKVLDAAVGGSYYEFEEIDIDAPSFDNYYTKEEADAAIDAKIAAGGFAKATDLDAANAKITANETAIKGKADAADVTALGEKVTANENAIAALPTGEQVDAKINTKVEGLTYEGGAAGANKYVTKVTQKNGIVAAEYANLPDYSEVYEEKGAAEAVKTEVEGKLGELGDKTVKGYVDDAVQGAVDGVAAQVKEITGEPDAGKTIIETIAQDIKDATGDLGGKTVKAYTDAAVKGVDDKVGALQTKVDQIPIVQDGEEVALDESNKLELVKASVAKLYIPEGTVLILNGGNSVR